MHKLPSDEGPTVPETAVTLVDVGEDRCVERSRVLFTKAGTPRTASHCGQKK